MWAPSEGLHSAARRPHGIPGQGRAIPGPATFFRSKRLMERMATGWARRKLTSSGGSAVDHDAAAPASRAAEGTATAG